MPHYLAALTPCRSTLAQDATEEEMQVIGEHFAQRDARRSAGELTLAGRTEGGDLGVMVCCAEAGAEADVFIAADPATKQGLMRAVRYPFR